MADTASPTTYGAQDAPQARLTGRDLAQMLMFALLVKPFMTFFIGLRVRGKEHLPTSYPFIVVANHSSHLDTLSLLSLFPLTRLCSIQPVAAADYFARNMFMAWFTKMSCNILPIARHDITANNDPIPRLVASLQAGKSLLIFPEGTRRQGDELGRLHSGVARVLEHLPTVPVVPAYLVNMGRSLPKGEWIPVPFFCEVRLGPPRILHGNRQEMMQTLATALQELRALNA